MRKCDRDTKHWATRLYTVPAASSCTFHCAQPINSPECGQLQGQRAWRADIDLSSKNVDQGPR